MPAQGPGGSSSPWEFGGGAAPQEGSQGSRPIVLQSLIVTARALTPQAASQMGVLVRGLQSAPLRSLGRTSGRKAAGTWCHVWRKGTGSCWLHLTHRLFESTLLALLPAQPQEPSPSCRGRPHGESEGGRMLARRTSSLEDFDLGDEVGLKG